MPTQSERPFRIKTTLGDDVLTLESFEGDEAMSRPFHYVVKMLSTNYNVDIKALLKKPVVLSIKLPDETERHIHGNISHIRQLEAGEDGMAAYEAEVVPWIWYLSLFADCRIFQNKDAQEIVQQIFTERGFTDFRWDLQFPLTKREYTVQYRESDLNFISRLMEDEGIFYYFEQTVDNYKLVLADSKTSIAVCPKQDTVRYAAATGSGAPDDNMVFSVHNEQRVHTGTVSLVDYNFKQPNVSLLANSSGEEVGEVYDNAGGHETKADGDRYARLRLEEEEVRLQTVSGESTCKGIECGYKSTLADHYRDELNQEYTFTSVHHSASNPSYRSGSAEGAYYRNQFTAIPSSVPFRAPRLTPKPVVQGTQTAMVVGKAGEEIWVDNYGRVKVQFFWDRMGQRNENSSCWVRVSQPWAGKNWGAMFIPRIGQEVIVDFIEGDPDHPIIIGRVYNGDQMPPYPLPDEQTKSTIKSMSSKGGAGFNEIRFEDFSGEEQIFIHAEKDMDIRVKNDRKVFIDQDTHLMVTRNSMTKISGDSHTEVIGKENTKIGGDRSLEVVGKEAIKIGGKHSLTVGGDVVEVFKANHSSDVTQALYLKAGTTVVIEATAGISLKVGGSFINVDPSGVTIFGPLVLINSGGAALTGVPGSADAPELPAPPTEADNAEPGSVTTVNPQEPATPASMTLDTISPTDPL